MKLQFLSEGSGDCPPVRLYDFDRTQIARLFAGMSALACHKQDSIAVHDLQDAEAVSDCRLFLRTGARERGMVRLPGSATFECTLSPESWDNVKDLAQPFLNQDGGNQWLVMSGDAKWLLSTDGQW